MVKRIVVLFLQFVLLGAFISGCKKDSDEEVGNQPPIVTETWVETNSVPWNSTCQICVEAIDPEGATLSYSWSLSDGEFTTPTHYPCVTWKSPNSSGTQICTIHITDSIHTIDKGIEIPVSDPAVLFRDDFSNGVDKWSFIDCEYSLEEGVLDVASNSSNQEYKARSYDFSPYAKRPWSISADVSIENAGHRFCWAGPSLKISSNGQYAYAYTWFLIAANDEDFNWAWVLLIPEHSQNWFFWDASTSSGLSPHVYTDGSMNHLQMIIDEDRLVTLKANGHILSEDNGGLNALNYYLGLNMSTSVINIALRVYGSPSTRWDNVEFFSTGYKESAVANGPVPDPPSEEEMERVFSQIKSGEILVLKDLFENE